MNERDTGEQAKKQKKKPSKSWSPEKILYLGGKKRKIEKKKKIEKKIENIF